MLAESLDPVETIKVSVRARPFLSHEKQDLPENYSDVFIKEDKIYICNRKISPESRCGSAILGWMGKCRWHPNLVLANTIAVAIHFFEK